mmetsp:Transcript_16630/g.40619  ORF Transcript_16630/g.40619 Transcript_16630/m.40619 type:complete len:307 (-) Transcript_16630:750-1670(-)
MTGTRTAARASGTISASGKRATRALYATEPLAAATGGARAPRLWWTAPRIAARSRGGRPPSWGVSSCGTWAAPSTGGRPRRSARPRTTPSLPSGPRMTGLRSRALPWPRAPGSACTPREARGSTSTATLLPSSTGPWTRKRSLRSSPGLTKTCRTPLSQTCRSMGTATSTLSALTSAKTTTAKASSSTASARMTRTRMVWLMAKTTARAWPTPSSSTGEDCPPRATPAMATASCAGSAQRPPDGIGAGAGVSSATTTIAKSTTFPATWRSSCRPCSARSRSCCPSRSRASPTSWALSARSRSGATK